VTAARDFRCRKDIATKSKNCLKRMRKVEDGKRDSLLL
jgi:hypothetical protein